MTGTARITRAKATFQKPMPTIASSTAITARLGSARPTFDTLIARKPPRCRCPSQMPIGSAMRAATKKPAANSLSVSRMLCHTRSSQRAPMNLKAFVKSLSMRSRRPRAGPRREQSLQQRGERIRQEAEGDREHGGGDQLRLERAAVDRVEDRGAEPLIHHERPDGGEADHRDGG